MRWAAGKKRRGGKPRNGGGATPAETTRDGARRIRQSTIKDTRLERAAPGAAPERDEVPRRLRAEFGVPGELGREVAHPEDRQAAFMAVRSGGTW